MGEYYCIEPFPQDHKNLTKILLPKYLGKGECSNALPTSPLSIFWSKSVSGLQHYRQRKLQVILVNIIKHENPKWLQTNKYLMSFLVHYHIKGMKTWKMILRLSSRKLLLSLEKRWLVLHNSCTKYHYLKKWYW